MLMTLNVKSLLSKQRCCMFYRFKIHHIFNSLPLCSIPIPFVLDHNWEAKKNMQDIDNSQSPRFFNKQALPWLSSYSVEFAISGSNVEVLTEPPAFFDKLKELSRSAKERITLASLYIGNGPLEKELVSCIYEGLEKSKDKLKAKILLDYTRGSRGKDNSRVLLLPLIRQFPSQVEVSLYHTPNLRGWKKWLLPERWNETIGLSHLKVYLFDDTLILSGANLSDQYFTNRQDRYVVFHNCSELANFFDDLVSTVSTFSFQLQSDNTVSLHKNWDVHPSQGNYKEFIRKANKSLQNFVFPISIKNTQRKLLATDNLSETGKSTCLDTLVYPLLQMKTLDISQDEQVVKKLLQTAEPESNIKLASGYFNLTSHYMKVILSSSRASYDLLVASPKVNGFYGAAGVAGAIPIAYTYIAKQFFHKILDYGEQHRIKLHEYERAAWTFHVKGLWYYRPEEKLPSVTFIGSPNFGHRSVYKDLEAQVAIVTTNEQLQEVLHNNAEKLRNFNEIFCEQIVVNQHEESLVAQGTPYDAVMAVGDVSEIVVSKAMIHAARTASKRIEFLNSKKVVEGTAAQKKILEEIGELV